MSSTPARAATASRARTLSPRSAVPSMSSRRTWNGSRRSSLAFRSRCCTRDKAKGEIDLLPEMGAGRDLADAQAPGNRADYVIEARFTTMTGSAVPANTFGAGRLFPRDAFRRRAIILAVYRKPNVFQHGSGYNAPAE